MRMSGLGRVYTMLYDDRMDVYRTVKVEDDDYTANISYQPEPLYTDIPCRLSFSSSDTATDADIDRTPVRYNPKVFCATAVDLQAGDYVVARRYADNESVMMEYEGVIGRPSKYPTHQEASLRIDEGA